MGTGKFTFQVTDPPLLLPQHLIVFLFHMKILFPGLKILYLVFEELDVK